MKNPNGQGGTVIVAGIGGKMNKEGEDELHD